MKITISLLLFLFFSCQSEPKLKKNNSKISIEKIESFESQDVLNNNFQIFYSEFRNNLIKMELNELKKKVNFPLVVSGFEDNDPRLKIGEDEFEFYLKLSMNVSEVIDYESNQSITTFDLIKENKIVDSLKGYEEGKNFQYIGSFYFSLDNNKWKLTEVYADTKK